MKRWLYSRGSLLLLLLSSNVLAQNLASLQREVDENPSFDRVASYVSALLDHGNGQNVGPYLTLLNDFVATEQQDAHLNYLTVRQNISEHQLCEAQKGVHLLEGQQSSFYLLALQQLWQARTNGIAEEEELSCFWQRTRSLMLSRGLLRSQSIYLDIKFELDKSHLSNASEQQLQALVTSLNSLDLTGFQLVVTGHADEQGSEQYNMTLSQNRAATVARYLELHLNKKQPIFSLGKGESAPLVDKAGERHYALNRRVEFHLQKTK